MSKGNPSNQSETPRVYKEEDLSLMIELISNGLWSNKNLVTALHIAESTIIEWKKRPEVQDAHRKAILKFVKKRTDTENILKELDVEVITDPSIQINNFNNLTDEQLGQLISAKTRQLGVVIDATGIGEAEEKQPAQLPETASEAI